MTNQYHNEGAVTVDRAGHSAGESDRQHASNQGHNLYVAGLSTRTEEPDLEELFRDCGQIDRCQVMRDPQTKIHRGFAFVTMRNVEGAQRAVERLNGARVHDRTIRVELGKRGRPRTPTPGRYLGPPKRFGEQAGRFGDRNSHSRYEPEARRYRRSSSRSRSPSSDRHLHDNDRRRRRQRTNNSDGEDGSHGRYRSSRSRSPYADRHPQRSSSRRRH